MDIHMSIIWDITICEGAPSCPLLIAFLCLAASRSYIILGLYRCAKLPGV